MKSGHLLCCLIVTIFNARLSLTISRVVLILQYMDVITFSVSDQLHSISRVSFQDTFNVFSTNIINNNEDNTPDSDYQAVNFSSEWNYMDKVSE